MGACGETDASLSTTSQTLDLSFQGPRRIVSHSLTGSLCQRCFIFFLFLWLVGGVGHLGWTEYCCARYDSVALCVRLLPQALIFPKQLYEAIFEEELTTIKIFVRLYGATLLSKLEKQNTLTQCVDIILDILTAARYKLTFFVCATLISQWTFLTTRWCFQLFVLCPNDTSVICQNLEIVMTLSLKSVMMSAFKNAGVYEKIC